ncbi:helix-turn-helix domain-containing protein [Mycobacterium sp. 155]|uniref:excisionase family DNA-binding protein n=1 Tax=Mycobacterium sp. 155 TaxID=1157943 RepID=UPI000369756D|nr:helix-turn-helix domain-containing protein [Mycobacterium sp. 155]
MTTLTVAEAAAQLGRSRRPIELAIQEGRLPATRVEKRPYLRVTQEDLDAYVAAQRGAYLAAAVARRGQEVEHLHSQGYLTVDEAAEQLGLAHVTITIAMAQGRLRSERIGGRRVTRPEWIATAQVGRPARVAPTVPDVVALPVAAQRSGLGRGTLLKAIRDGRLPAVPPSKTGESFGIKPADLEAFAAGQKPRAHVGGAVTADKAAEWRREQGVLSVTETAAALGISVQAVRARIHAGALPAHRSPAGSPSPRSWLIREEEVTRRVA